MTKILLSTHYYNTHRGGVEIVAFNIAKNLLKFCDSYQINWVASNCDEIPQNISNMKYIPIKSTNFIEKILPFPYPIPYLSGIKTIFKQVKKSNIIHIHDFLYLQNIISFFFAKYLKKKIIITQHIGFIPYKNSFFRFFLNLLNKTLGQYMLSKADRTIFISHQVQKYFEQFLKIKNNIEFIPNGLDTSIYKVYDNDKKLELKEKYNFNGINFLFVGRFTEKKGLFIIKELAKHFKNINFILAGWGYINPDDWKLANIRVISGLQGCEIAELYNISDALILASYGEGFPLVVQEAMACGLGVLVSNEIIKGYPKIENLIYGKISGNINEINQSIETLNKFLNNYQHSTARSIELSNFAKENWDFDIIIEKYLNVFKSLR